MILTLDTLSLSVSYRVVSGESSAIMVGDHITVKYDRLFNDHCFTVFRWRRNEDEGNIVWNFKKAEKVIDLLSDFDVIIDKEVAAGKIEDLRFRIDTLIYNYGLDDNGGDVSWRLADKNDPRVDWSYRNLFDSNGNVKDFAIPEKEEQ
jgi:hypothetical protein